MKRYIVAAFAFIILTAVAIPAFAEIPSDNDLKTAPGIEKLFADEQQGSN
jgi:hypothetical protein